jgi:dipeptidase E
MRLLLISNSTNPGEPFLDYPKNNIKAFLGNKLVEALFIPYASVTFSYDDYATKVYDRFREIGHSIIPIHRCNDPVDAVKVASVIMSNEGVFYKFVMRIKVNRLWTNIEVLTTING